jgi:hypothetical protein
LSELPPPPPPPPPPPSPSSLPTTRPRKFNTKMILGVLIILIIVVASVVAFLMNPGNPGGGGAKTVATQDDAYEVALAVNFAATGVASRYSGTSPIVWNNQRVNGALSGYAIVNGNYEETRDNSGFWGRGTRTYNDVTIQFYDYQGQSFYPSITGDETLDGSVSYQEGASHTTYSGVWRLTGSVTLSGSYTGSLAFDIAIQDSNGWYGTITSDGQTWNVSFS